MRAIGSVSQIPATRHYAIIEYKDFELVSYTPFTEHAEFVAALQARVEVVGTGNVTGITVQSKARFEVQLVA